MAASIHRRFLFIFVVFVLLTFYEFELLEAGGHDKVELFGILGQGREDMGEAQFLVGSGYVGSARLDTDVLRAGQFLLAALVAFDVGLAADVGVRTKCQGFHLKLNAGLAVGVDYT